jgi:hypothetical protein
MRSMTRSSRPPTAPRTPSLSARVSSASALRFAASHEKSLANARSSASPLAAAAAASASAPAAGAAGAGGC